jgi:peptidoglycan/LPS O-acetylase OafA/YrhL
MTASRREPGIDVLRGLALVGVVLGHWLVTAPLAPDPVTGAVRLDSPLRTMPDLAPVSWLLQTLGLFCLVAGFAAARSRRASTEPPVRWWWLRMRRLAGPGAALLAAVSVGVVVLGMAGAPQGLVVRVVRIAVTPLWFLGVYLVLSAATPLLVRLDARFGGWAAAGAALLAGTLAAIPETARVGVLTAWWVPWQLGIAMARRPLGRGAAASLLVAGAAAVFALVASGVVPPTAVGVPGADRSNLDPPSVATIALALAQAGAAALVLPVLGRAPGVLARVGSVGRSAYPVFLLHQTVFAAVWLGTLPVGPLHGLHDGPAAPGWLAARVCWLVVLSAALALVLRSRAATSPD